MAQVMFKKGLSTALPKTGLVEGAFYLTTDTDKLYICNDGNKLSLLNQVVHNVANIAALPAIADAAVGEFYYCVGENVLATKKAAADTNWTQINADTDTHLDPENCTQTTGIATESNIATITTKLKQVNKDGSQSAYGNPEFSFRIKGAGDNIITRETDGTIVITGKNDDTTYTLGTEATAADAVEKKGKIKLTSSSGSAQTVEVAGEGDIVVTSGANGTLTVDGTKLKDTIASTAAGVTIDSIKNAFAADGNFTTEIKLQGKDIPIKAPAITPIIKLGTNATEYKFESGTATLPVYTKTEVDGKIDEYFKAADAMVYKGTVSDTVALPTANVQRGWTFKVAAAGTYAGTVCKVGDLIIAKVDAATPTDATWDVVPSGDDQVITGAAANTGITISDGAGVLAGFTIVNGDCTTASGTPAANGKTTEIKVNHNPATGTLAAGSTVDITQPARGTAEFSAITGITRDAYGHITGTTVKKLTVVDTDTHHDVTTVATTATHNDSGAVITTMLTQDGVTPNVHTTLNVVSDNLKVTNGGTDGTIAKNTLKINLEWGTF